jgi:hypothetical protein
MRQRLTRSRAGDAEPPLVYRGTALLVLGGICLAVGAWFIVDALGGLGHKGERVGVGVTLVLGVLVVAAAIRPALVADDDGVLVRNPFRSIRVPWSRVTGFSVRYALDVDTGDRAYSSWAVSRPSWRREHGIVAGSRRSAVYADEVAEELTIRLNARRGIGVRTATSEPGTGPGEDVTVTWSRPMLIALAVAVAVLVVLAIL